MVAGLSVPVLVLIGTTFAISSCIAILALRKSTKSYRNAALQKQIDALSFQYDALDEKVERLRKLHHDSKRRENLERARAKKHSNGHDMSDDEWRKEMNKRLGLGNVKVEV